MVVSDLLKMIAISGLVFPRVHQSRTSCSFGVRRGRCTGVWCMGAASDDWLGLRLFMRYSCVNGVLGEGAAVVKVAVLVTAQQ